MSNLDPTLIGTTYKPTSSINFLGILLLFWTAVIGGFTVGLFSSLANQIVYLIIVSPILTGLVGVYVMSTMITMSKVRSTAWVTLLGALMGVMIYSGILYGNYSFALGNALEGVDEAIKREGLVPEDIPGEEKIAFIDQYLEQETGFTGFLGYLILEHREGLTIFNFRTNFEFRFPPIVAWIYSGAELFLLVALCARANVEQVQRPYCHFHRQWYKTTASLGCIPKEQFPLALQKMAEGDYETVWELFDKPRIPYVEFMLMSCDRPDCQESYPMIRFQDVGMDKQQQETRDDLHIQIISHAQLEVLKGE